MYSNQGKKIRIIDKKDINIRQLKKKLYSFLQYVGHFTSHERMLKSKGKCLLKYHKLPLISPSAFIKPTQL